MSVPHDVLMRVNPLALDQALPRWNEEYGASDESLAIDGKTMRNSLDDNARQVHIIMSVVGHRSNLGYTQKQRVLSW
ncbi:MAG: hypothetical protein ACU836_16300 [Gammaproteobacteria bacterium]